MPFNYNTQGITNPDANDPRNLGGSEGYGNPTASGSSGIMSSTANTTSNDDDDKPSFFESIANLFSGAGADLPSDNNDDGDSGASFYSGPMFGPFNNGSDDSGSDNNSSSTSPTNKPLPTSAADRAVYEALGIDVPEVYRGELGEWEPEPNINMDVLQKALQPDPIAVEEIEVKAGDTLSGIAKDKGVPVQDVINANPQIKNPDLIRPGEKVTVPDVYSGESTMERMARESAELAASKRDAAGITRSLTPEEVKERNAALKAASEDPDRKFYQSTIPIEDRTFPAEAEQADGIMSKPLTDDDMGLPESRSTEEQSVAAEQYLNENLYSTDAPINVSNMQISGTNFSDRNNAIDEVARGLSNTYTDEEVAALKATIARESGVSLVERKYTKEGAIRKFPNYATELRRLPDDVSGDAIFDIVYGRENMGNTEAGDGSKYIGRGLIQITGKNNYRDVSERLGLGDLLVTNPELVATDPAIMVAATKAYLDMKGFGSDTLSANSLKDTIGHGGGAIEAETRWANTIEDLRTQGKDDLADELVLNNEFTAQRVAGTTVDGDIGPNSRTAMTEWLGRAPRNITVPQGTSNLDLVRMVNTAANS
jgi:putative chitinase